MIIANVTNNAWCPYCAIPSNKLCDKQDCTDCTDCFEKSFASHQKAVFWSDTNKLKPRQIFKSSNKKCWFNCQECLHEFEIILSSVTHQDSWCNFCSNKNLCDKDCTKCFDKSFASHQRAIFWSNKNLLKPNQIFKSSNNKYIFNCDKCNNEFEGNVNSITSMGSWCPHCRHKTELKLFEWLKDKFKTVEKQVRFDWCKIKRTLPFDFVIEDLNLIIELDGAQHFRQVSNWKSPEEQEKIDNFKMECALNNNYRIIRICQEIVLFDRENWENQLLNAIRYDELIIKIGSVYGSAS